MKKKIVILFLLKEEALQNYSCGTASIEVIEHLDQPRLKAFERVVFEFSNARTIIISTPNREYNILWDGFDENKLRQNDHRFEWTRKEFQVWSKTLSQKYGYSVRFVSIGPDNPEHGSPTQAAVFTKDKED